MKKTTRLLATLALFIAVSWRVNAQCTSNFTYSLGANGTVTFSSTSTGTTSTTLFTWQFGGGQAVFSASGTAGWTASTNYTVNGTYVVNLTIGASLTPCYSASQQTITVTSSSNNCNLSANMFITTTNTSNVVQFMNASTGTVPGTTYAWDFGDGNTGTGFQPIHTYTSTGLFSVQMVANNNSVPTCTDISGSLINMCTGITSTISPSTGPNGQVNIACPSTGTNTGTTYTWNINGTQGNWQSHLANPSFTLPNGFYQVILFARDSANFSCLISADDTITVTNSSNCILSAGFNMIGNGNAWYFANTTSNSNVTTGYSWNFGDGSTSSQNSPSHTYTVPGIYTVTLVATNMQVCTSTFTAIVNTACVANAGFTLVPTNTLQVWYAIPGTTANIAAATWWWGDGSNSNTLFTSHQYSAAGMYSICLSVTLTCGASDVACASYSVYRSSRPNEIILVNVVAPGSLNAGLAEMNASSLMVYPNPGNGTFEISMVGFRPQGAVANVRDLQGRLVYSAKMQRNDSGVEHQVKLDPATPGFYMLEIEMDGFTLNRKIIVEK